MDLSPEKLRMIVEYLIIFILSVTVHEFGHAFVADRLGDRLPRSQGRVTLNPMAHADPIGTLLMPVIGGLTGIALFAWGRPVQVQPQAFSRKFTMRTGHMMVAFAGPAMNVLFALTIAIVTLVLGRTGVLDPSSHIYGLLHQAIFLNFVLCIFNLVPATPLDGYTVVEGFLPTRSLPAWREYGRYGIFVMMAILFVPGLSRVISWPAMQCYRGLTGLLGI
jgi:Zn-dependent protease